MNSLTPTAPTLEALDSELTAVRSELAQAQDSGDLNRVLALKKRAREIEDAVPEATLRAKVDHLKAQLVAQRRRLADAEAKDPDLLKEWNAAEDALKAAKESAREARMRYNGNSNQFMRAYNRVQDLEAELAALIASA